MDSITQALLGATIAQAGWRNRLGGRALVVGAVAATVPDLDIVAGLAGDWASLVHHRGISHSLVFAPALCAPLGWVAWRFARRRGELRDWIHLVFWALLTHPLLDLFTPYGTQLLLPFSNQRFAIDALSIIDPVYSGALIAALVVGVATKRPTVRSVAAWTALALSSAYVLFGYSQSLRAERAVVDALPSEFALEEIRAFASFGNVFGWRVVARDVHGNLAVSSVSTLRPNEPKFATLERPLSPLVEAALAHPHGETTRWFAMDMLGIRIEQEGGEVVVYLDDQRYGRHSDVTKPLWGARFAFDFDGVLLGVSWHQDFERRRIVEELRAIRALIAGVPVSP